MNNTTSKSESQAINDTLLSVSFFDNRNDNRPKQEPLTWYELCQHLTTHTKRKDKDGGLWSPTLYPRGKSRSNESVESVCCYVADVDDGTMPASLYNRWKTPDGDPLAFCLHSTHSSQPDKPKWRITFPLVRPVPAKEWEVVYRKLTAALMCGHTDPQCKDASRMYYSPACPPEMYSHAFADCRAGRLLDHTIFRDCPEPPSTETSPPQKPKREHPDFNIFQRVPAEMLVDDAVRRIEELNGRNGAGFWLACQLRDNRYSQNEAESILRDYQARCPNGNHPYTIQEALHSVESAFNRAAREEWAKPGVNLSEKFVNAPPGVNTSSPTPSRRPILHQAAYHGLAGDFVSAVEPHTESDPAALLVQFLACFGSVIGRSAFFSVEASQHYGNLFVCVVGSTSKGRKGTGLAWVEAIFQKIAPEWKQNCVKSGICSGEGLINAVRDPVTRIDKEGNKITIDDGVIDKRLLCRETEFASVLRVIERDGNTVSARVRDAWDSGDLSTLSKNSPQCATNAHISIISHITMDELRRYLTRTESGNGFANRFLWVYSQRSKLLPDGGKPSDATLTPLTDRVRQTVQIARSISEVSRDETASVLWRRLYERLANEVPGLLGAITSRGEAQMVRLSLLYALLDGSAVIRKEHLQAALAVWRYAEDSARHIFGDATGDTIADEILEALRGQPNGMTTTEINNLFSRNLTANRLRPALELLLNYGLIRRTEEPNAEQKGRPVLRFFSCPTKTTLPTDDDEFNE